MLYLVVGPDPSLYFSVIMRMLAPASSDKSVGLNLRPLGYISNFCKVSPLDEHWNVMCVICMEWSPLSLPSPLHVLSLCGTGAQWPVRH